MSLSLHSLYSQKKGAAFSFVLAVVVTALVMALFAFATSGPSFAQQFTPRWVQASAANATVNITITNIAGSTAAIKRIDFTRPSTVANYECGGDLPDGWTCTRSAATVVQFSTAGAGIAAGASAPFMINITPPAVGGNQTFVIDTYESAGGANANTSGNPTILNVNSSVDNDFPFVQLMNISARRSDGSRISINGVQTNGLFFLPNTSDGYVFVINASDNASGMDNGRVTLYYNISTNSAPNNIVNLIDYRNASLANVSSFQASNGTVGGPLSLYNVTLNISSMASINGTRIAFILLANDSVRNGNVSNSSASAAVSTYVYNFTIDAVAPQFNDVQLSNGSQVSTNAINTTGTAGSRVEYILNSSLFLNLTVNVSDSGGSGTVLVEVLNRTGGFMRLDLLTGANASAGQTVWKINATTNVSGGSGNYNVTDLIQGFSGDGQYNITFRATDNVSNQNATYNFTVEVDDSPPTASVASNISIIGTSILSVGNTTLTNTSFNNTAFVLRVQTSSNINANTTNISVFGNLGKVFNLTFESGTPSGTAVWNLTVKAATLVNATEFCTFGSTASTFGPDASTCNFRFNFSDALGRHNDTINLTVFVDSNAPAVFSVSPVAQTTNYSQTALINFSVNDTVGPLQNVSFRLRNDTLTHTEGEGAYGGTTSSFATSNVTNWIPMSLGTGNNSQPSNGGTWNFTINLTTANLADGTYIVEVNATDSAGRSNFSTNVSNVIFDSTPPQNISIVAPATNSFHRANFTVNLNATERVSGLLNVSVRLENSTHNLPWVGTDQLIQALTTSGGAGATVRFNASGFNMTNIGWNAASIGGLATNATNGNFTLRLNVTDTAGNQNTSVLVNLTIDTIVPSVTLIEPVNLINRTANFTINLSATESNIGTVQYRWENGSDLTNQGQNFSNWITFFSNAGGANNWNSTFNVTEGTSLATNYTVRVNVTDKAGNQNSSVYVQLVIDKNAPLVVASSNASLANSVQTGNFVVNLTINDTGTWGMTLGKITSTNVNATAYRLENNTFNSSWLSIPFATVDLTDANSNRTNTTFTFSSVANGRYDIRFFVNDTSGNQNNTVTVLNVTLDNVVPSVAISIVNVSPAASGGTGISGNITFNASVNDNLPLNISITSLAAGQGQTYGVFYRLENSSYNGSWLPMSVSASVANLSATFNASNFSNTLVDGDYKVRINATDTANNQNTTVFTSITIQNAGSKVRAVNLTFQGGLLTGTSDTNQTSPTWLVNTTTNATCRYSLDTPVTNYDDMTNTMNNNVSRQLNAPLGFLPDRAANGYSIDYACKDVGGNFTLPDGVSSKFTFSADTRNFFNVTMGSGGTNKVRGDYFAVGWNSFTLPKTTLLANTGVPTNYNVTNVLSSLGNSRLTTANFTVLYAYNGSDWAVYRVGGGANTFSNFTADTPTATYYLNITVANERLEIN